MVIGSGKLKAKGFSYARGNLVTRHSLDQLKWIGFLKEKRKNITNAVGTNY